MLDQEKIDILKREFDERAANYKMLMEYREKFLDRLWKTKLAFIAFIGVLFTIIFNQSEKFGENFLKLFLSITILTFLLIIYDFWLDIRDRWMAIKEQHSRTILAKIRHIAGIEKDQRLFDKFSDYAKRAEELLLQENKTRQNMMDNKSITEIIKYPSKDKSWILELIIWAILFISIPILFLLKILGVV